MVAVRRRARALRPSDVRPAPAAFWPSSRLVALLAACGALAGARMAHAQALPPKRVLTLPSAAVCLNVAAPLEAGRRDPQAARAAAASGRELALAGDRAGAAAAFARAVTLDPQLPAYAYDLGRAAEDAGDRRRAGEAYCRFLALAPQGALAQEVRTRLAALPGGAPAASEPAIRAEFARGVAALDARRFPEAVRAFDAVLAAAPSAPEARYDRGLALLAQRRDAEAARDLAAYLTAPTAGADRADVLRAVERLRQPARTPAGALGRGLLVPGLGQVYTGRPILGAAVVGVVTAAAVVAARTQTTERPVTYTDPFGNPYTGVETVRERPDLAAGLFLAAGVSLGAALESAVHASRHRRERPTLLLRATSALRPDAEGRARPAAVLAVRLTLPR